MGLPYRALAVDDSLVATAASLDAAIAGANAYFIATRLPCRVLDEHEQESYTVGIQEPRALLPVEQTSSQPESETVVAHPAEPEVKA
jgi:hypothetical protein